jgi:hypothetical protein
MAPRLIRERDLGDPAAFDVGPDENRLYRIEVFRQVGE